MSASPRWRGVRTLDVLSAVAGVAAVVLWLLPADPTVPPAPVRVPAAAANGSVATGAWNGAAADSLRRALVRTNLFSASRREPASRFTAPGVDTAPTAAFVPTDAGAPTDDAEAGPRLFGIVSSGGARRALLQLGGADEPPRLLREGESYAGVRVVRIAGDRVVLSGSTGTRTLRLSRSVPDSSEKVP
jgi:hypothetical protein